MSDRLAEMLEIARTIPKSTVSLLASYKDGAATRGHSFEISDEVADALFQAPCHYCGYKPSGKFSGIDRVNNNLGYVEGNVVSCCAWCNRAKGRFSVEAFMEWLQWVRSDSSALPDAPLPIPGSGIEWPESQSATVGPVRIMPITAEPDLGGLTVQEYVKAKVWGTGTPVRAKRPDLPRKPIRILRAHDYKSIAI